MRLSSFGQFFAENTLNQFYCFSCLGFFISIIVNICALMVESRMMDNTAVSSGNEEGYAPGWSPLRWLVGLFSLALRSGSELTHLIGQMHRTVADSPPPFALPPFLAGPPEHHPRHDHLAIPKTYLLIRLLLEQGADRLHQWVGHLPSQDHLPVPLRRVHSGMNGVIGDKLQAWRHPLAQPLELVDHNGCRLTLAQVQARSERGVLLFVHGLCLSELDWQTPANQRFVRDLQSQGFGVAWVRYNSGLPIWENGHGFSHYLHEHWQRNGTQSLTLVGHSMGGLVIRSALYHGEHIHDSDWVNAIERVAYLASPHSGAPLEKIGNFANSLLGVSPYSKPLMALGNIRSLGIRSLRHGHIVAPVDGAQKQPAVPFNPRIRHLLLAAKMRDGHARRWLGDGLVPVSSAMGEAHFPASHEQVERVVLDNVGHIRLLSDERTYDALRRWMGLSSGQG